MNEQQDDLPRLNLYHNEIEPAIASKIESGDYEGALFAIASGVASFNMIPYVFGHTLFLAGFDRLLLQLGQRMHDDPEGKAEWTPGTARLIILSEFYNSGGHSLVTADLVQAMGGAVVVLTDLFGKYLKGTEKIETATERMPMAMVHRLQKLGIAEKVRELQTIFRAVRPQSVMFMVHHPDPIAFVAAASLPRSVKKIFMHHCDHNPALGGTLEDYVHVDFTRHIQHFCEQHLQRKSIVLPLFVEDRGVKTFSQPAPNAMNIVTAGSSTKYKFDGPFAYHLVVAEILAATGGHYWHIGSLGDAIPEFIRNALRERGIDPARFTYIPSVPSLWDTLKEIDAHVFLNSFPVAGVRGAIEVQGCGYPLVYFALDDRPPLLRHTELFADLDLGWRSIPELIDKLKLAGENHAERVARSRQFYLQGYGREVFMRAVDEVLS